LRGDGDFDPVATDHREVLLIADLCEVARADMSLVGLIGTLEYATDLLSVSSV